MKAGRTGAEAQRRRQNGSARGEKKGREEREGRGLKKRTEAKIEKKGGKRRGRRAADYHASSRDH